MNQLWPELVESLRLDLLGHLVVAILLGGAIGLERELQSKPAGLRTNVLICVGAALFTDLSRLVAGATGDPGRIAAQIVTGVGFLGAGTILHSRGYITGLTSAATIWLVAAIGMAVGMGAVLEATGATLLVLVVLGVLRWFERHMKGRRQVSRVIVEFGPDRERVDDIEQIVRKAGLELQELHSERQGEKIVVEVVMRGPRHGHDDAKRGLLKLTGSYTVAMDE